MMIYVMYQTCQVSIIAVRSFSQVIFGHPHGKLCICDHWWFMSVDKSCMLPCRTLCSWRPWCHA